MSKTSSDIISIIVRIMPKGDELEVELPFYSTGKEIISELVNAGVAPKTDQEGNAYVYELISKRSNQKIGDDKTLQDVGVKEGEILYLAPKLVAGQAIRQDQLCAMVGAGASSIRPLSHSAD